MANRLPPTALVIAALLFLSGIAASFAWKGGLYANAAVAGLIGIWLAALLLSRLERPPLPKPVPAASTEATLRALETETRRLRTMLDQTPAPLVAFAADGTLRAVNRAARTLFRTDDRVTAPLLGGAIGRVTPGERTTLKLPAGGATRSYALSVAAFAGSEGALKLAVLTDIEAELQAAEAAALKDLLQVLSHEIMNSLTPVTSLAESAHALLTEGSAEDVPQAADALGTILRRARGLDRFVQGYRLLARLPEPALRPVSLAELLHDVAALFETRWRERQVALVLDPPAPDIIARLDADLMTQALLNLLANGAEAALASTARPPRVTLSGFMQGSGAALRVTDSGDGVPAGQEEAIFRPFFTLKPGGTGIGLGLARQVAMSHGGTLVLEPPAPDRGAAFLIVL